MLDNETAGRFFRQQGNTSVEVIVGPAAPSDVLIVLIVLVGPIVPSDVLIEGQSAPQAGKEACERTEGPHAG